MNGWGPSIAIALLTAVAGAGVAGYVASLCIDWYRISSFEGKSGFFVVGIGALGLFGGLIAGIVTPRMVAGFWRAQGFSLAIVLGVCACAALIARFNGEVAPELNGERLDLQVELRCPRGWSPDNKARSGRNSCWLTPIGSGNRKNAVSGDVTWKHAAEIDGQWVVPSSVTLFSSRKMRLLRVIIGNKTDIEFLVPLPPHPGAKDEQWSEWSSEGFAYPIGAAPRTEYAFRCRVQRASVVARQQENEKNAVREAAAALSSDAPLSNWIALFEDGDTGRPRYDDRTVSRAVAVVKARAPELAPFLRSPDANLVRQAVYAIVELQETPAVLIQPLADAGRLTLTLIREARAGALPNDPDIAAEKRASGFFFKWTVAMKNAGPAAARQYRLLLEEIQRETSQDKTGEIANIANYVTRELHELASGAPQ